MSMPGQGPPIAVPVGLFPGRDQPSASHGGQEARNKQSYYSLNSLSTHSRSNSTSLPLEGRPVFGSQPVIS